jgi:hypothetical protein
MGPPALPSDFAPPPKPSHRSGKYTDVETTDITVILEKQTEILDKQLEENKRTNELLKKNGGMNP